MSRVLLKDENEIGSLVIRASMSDAHLRGGFNATCGKSFPRRAYGEISAVYRHLFIFIAFEILLCLRR